MNETSRLPGRVPWILEVLVPTKSRGRLLIPLGNGTTARALLKGRHVRILLPMKTAYDEDAGMQEEDRGFRTAKEIVGAYYTKEEQGILKASNPEPTVVPGYLSQISRLIKSVVPADFDRKLFGSERFRGTRLLDELVVKEVWRDRRTPPPPSP